jgi:endonuclease-3
MTRKERCTAILGILKQNNPNPETELHYTQPYELLVAVILSAQCTDKRVNLVTPNFFKKFPTVNVLQKGSFEEVFELIRSISFPNNKAKHLLGMAEKVVNDFAGEIPNELEDLVKLPGVGRKTANVILSVIYGQAALAVDTHVFRVSQRMGIAKGNTPLQIESQLMKVIPTEKVADSHHLLILHGRYVCTARSPKCNDCKVAHLCKWEGRKRNGFE